MCLRAPRTHGAVVLRVERSIAVEQDDAHAPRAEEGLQGISAHRSCDGEGWTNAVPDVDELPARALSRICRTAALDHAVDLLVYYDSCSAKVVYECSVRRRAPRNAPVASISDGIDRAFAKGFGLEQAEPEVTELRRPVICMSSKKLMTLTGESRTRSYLVERTHRTQSSSVMSCNTNGWGCRAVGGGARKKPSSRCAPRASTTRGGKGAYE